MRHKTMTLIAGTMLPGILVTAADFKPEKWHMLPPVATPQPLLIDSLDAKGELYDAVQLLEGMRMRPLESVTATIASAADTTATINLPAPSGCMEIIEYSTPLRASRYAEGTLKIESPMAYKLYVNGEEKGSSDGKSAAPVSARMVLEPQADYELRLRFLSQPGDTSSRTFTAAFSPDEKYADVELASDPDMKRRFALSDTEFGSRVRSAELSHDGQWLLTTVTTKHSPKVSETKLLLRNLKTGKETWLSSAEPAQWMPRSNRLSVAVRNNDTYDIYLLDPADGSRRLVAEGLPQPQYQWNPAEDRIYFMQTDEGKKESGPLRRYKSPDDRIPGNRDLVQLAVMDPSTGISTPITRGSRSCFLIDFHPDGKRLLIMTATSNPEEWPFQSNSLYEYDPSTGALDTIIAKSGFVSDAAYSPDGNSMLIASAPQEFGGIGDRSGAPIANSYDRQLFILDRKSGDIGPITADFDPAFDGPMTWNRADGKIYFRAVKGFGDRIYNYDPRTRKFAELPLDIENVTSFSMGADGSRIAYCGMSRDHMGEERLYDVRSGKDISVADPSAEALGRIGFGNFERWDFTSSDGTEIEGYAVYPPDFDPSKKYPLIVYYYGGTLPTQFSLTSPYNPHLAASRGYVVYMLNPSGTIGYGQEFSARHVNAWGKRTAEDIIDGTKKFVAEHPFVDAGKIGCIGASYGGFMTQYLQTLTDIFAAAVSHAGISDVTSYWGEGYWGYSYNAVAAAKSYPWQNPELFTRQGSLFNADKIHTPILLLHGTADTNVPVGESIQLFNALKILGREAELVTVDGENHFISDYDKRKLWNDTFMAWFARWLQDDPRWWDTLYPAK